MKKFLLKFLFAALSISISLFLCYFFIDDIFVRYATATQSFLCLRLFIAVLIYFSINWVMKNPIYTLERDILFFSYLLLSISVSLLRFRLSSSTPLNFNVISIINYSKMTLFFNILFYIPFGFYFGKRIKLKTVYNFIIFLGYILIIEVLQHYLRTGFFDINDFILNGLGFLAGYASQKIIMSFLTYRRLST